MTNSTREEAVPDRLASPALRGAGSSAGTAVDAHHHLWDPADPDQDWLRGPGLERLLRPFGPDDLRAAASHGVAGRDVRSSVAVQSVATLRETAALLTTASSDPTVAAVVGWVDLTVDVTAQLDGLRAGPGGDLLRGCRHLVQSEDDPRWLLRDDVLRGLHALAAAGLPYDLLVRPHQLPAAAELAARVPGLPLVLDHAGKPDPARTEQWEVGVRALARHSQVTCKVSGLVTELDLSASTSALDAVWTVLLDAFGPARLMWGSDWPVCLLAAAYERWAGLTSELVAPLSHPERHEVLAGTATDFYDLDPDRQQPPTHLENP